jgi:hypothetical protein
MSSSAFAKASAPRASCPCPAGLAARFLQSHDRRAGKALRRCHPRDALSHALNLIHFEKLPCQLTEQLLHRAFESCFVQDQQAAAPAESAILPSVVQSCADYWGDRRAQIPTGFGTLSFIAGFHDRAGGRYREVASVREYGEAETSRTLARLHQTAFRDWLVLNLEQQARDLTLHAASTEGALACWSGNPQELAAAFLPAGASAEERQLFSNNLEAVLSGLALSMPVRSSPIAHR